MLRDALGSHQGCVCAARQKPPALSPPRQEQLGLELRGAASRGYVRDAKGESKQQEEREIH